MNEKDLQEAAEDRSKQTLAQRTLEWKKLGATARLSGFFCCSCCGGIIERVSVPDRNGCEDLCQWCVDNASPGWIMKEDQTTYILAFGIDTGRPRIEKQSFRQIALIIRECSLSVRSQSAIQRGEV
jgi:hypothetical protein